MLSVSITANKDYNSEYPAGADLSPMFKAQEYYYGDSQSTFPVAIANEEFNLYIAFLNYLRRLQYQQESYSANTQHPFWILKPTLLPSSTNESFIFTVAVKFTDETVVTSATPPLILE